MNLYQKLFCVTMLPFFSTIISCAARVDAAPAPVFSRVKVSFAEEKTEYDDIIAYGTLSFQKKVDVLAEVEGRIRSIRKYEGEQVHPGDVLAFLENPLVELSAQKSEDTLSQAQTAYSETCTALSEGERQAEAALLTLEKSEKELSLSRRAYEEAKRKHEDTKRLFEAGGVSYEELHTSAFSLETQAAQLALSERELDIKRIGFRESDLLSAGMTVPSTPDGKRLAYIILTTKRLRSECEAASSRVRSAEKELAAAKTAQNNLVIRSPASGIKTALIANRQFSPGEQVKSGDKLFTLVDEDSLYAVFPVSESESLTITPGMPASICIESTEEEREGVVDLVSPMADTASFTFQVRVRLNENTDNSSRAGMFVRVTIHTGKEHKVILVNNSCVNETSADEGEVFVVKGDVLSRRNVKLGLLSSGKREIVAGLNAGEACVVKPASSLKEGTHVSAYQ